jgi:hypothetical protein
MPTKPSKSAEKVMTGRSVAGSVYAYEFEKEVASDRLKKFLPNDARFVVVTAKRYPASKFAKQFKIKRSGKAVVRWHTSSPPTEAEVGAEAYRPDAKARALLRGVRLVEQDLKSSGGAYSLAEVQMLMRDISRQAVNNRVREGTLLAVPGPSNRACYPAIQFTESGLPVEGLREVRQALGTENPWMILNFLANADPQLEGRRPIDMLKAGEVNKVIEVARRVGVQGA